MSPKSVSRLAFLRARYASLASQGKPVLPDEIAMFHPSPRCRGFSYTLARHERETLARDVFLHRVACLPLRLTA